MGTGTGSVTVSVTGDGCVTVLVWSGGLLGLGTPFLFSLSVVGNRQQQVCEKGSSS